MHLPPYSPELNPVERVFQELRRQIEGQMYGRMELKVEAAERVLRALAADPGPRRAADRPVLDQGRPPLTPCLIAEL